MLCVSWRRPLWVRLPSRLPTPAPSGRTPPRILRTGVRRCASARSGRASRRVLLSPWISPLHLSVRAGRPNASSRGRCRPIRSVHSRQLDRNAKKIAVQFTVRYSVSVQNIELVSTGGGERTRRYRRPASENSRSRSSRPPGRYSSKSFRARNPRYGQMYSWRMICSSSISSPRSYSSCAILLRSS